MERIIEKLDLSKEHIGKILWSFGLTRNGDIRPVGGGRIANNLLISTIEKGDIIIRAYPHAYGETKVRFEVDVLRHLSERGCDVPCPLSLARNRKVHSALLSLSDLEIFVYPALRGTTINQCELNKSLAGSAGKALATIASHSISFSAADLMPQGDLGFIAGLLRAAKERDAALASHQITAEMEQVLSNAELVRALDATSQGIVHADFFFENILANDQRSEVTGVLDFGDAYYGAVVNDVVIGAMEFSVSDKETWDISSWGAFIKENQTWLRREKFASQNMRKLLLANCIRFAMYTLPFSYADGDSLEKNRYVRRFLNITNTKLGDELESSWKEIVQL